LFGSKVLNKRFGPYLEVECTSPSPSRRSGGQPLPVSSNMCSCRDVKEVQTQTCRHIYTENIDEICLAVGEAYVAFLDKTGETHPPIV